MLIVVDTLLIEIFTHTQNIITIAITFTSNNISGNSFRLANECKVWPTRVRSMILSSHLITFLE